MSSALSHAIDRTGVTLTLSPRRSSLLARFVSQRGAPASITDLEAEEKDLLFALADLRNWQELHPEEVEIGSDRIRISHNAAASLSSRAAAALGLPQDPDMILGTDVTGTLGRPEFRLHYQWTRDGRRETPDRCGAFLQTARGWRRVPLWMKRVLDLADDFEPEAPLEDHWRALAEFRRMMEPEETGEMPENREVARLSMTAFLRGLQVRVADRFSIAPDASLSQFEVVPYSSRRLTDNNIADEQISETDAELSGEALAVFQARLRQGGAKPAYLLGANSYLVIDRGALPVLGELARAQKAEREERKAFIANPRVFVSEAVTRHLENAGAFGGIDDANQEEMTATAAAFGFIESREYSERVTGVVAYQRPTNDREGSGTSWLPEVFSDHVAAGIRAMPDADLTQLHDAMQAAIASGEDPSVDIGGERVDASPARLAAVAAEMARRERQTALTDGTAADVSATDETRTGRASEPLILDTLDNYEDLAWHQALRPRQSTIPVELPSSILTPLRAHQIDGFRWSVAAWQSGLPGILNADEQGLGKTLQTIAFLAWIQLQMRAAAARPRGPILVVAPTSLLRNWEQEVEVHVSPRQFGTLVRLYGTALSANKRRGARGTETETGLPMLDLDWLHEAFEEGRAHRYWVLTTYTTLANYQHSLGRIPFTAMVMDEVQNIKNRATIASKAVEAMNADFRIGLTGTPIENATIDLWTIMDRISPGALGSGVDFRARYGTPDEDNMRELHSRVFRPTGRTPPLAIRRLKDEVAADLPRKSRLLHPRLMPTAQAQVYEEARRKLAEGGPGAQLKMLHHIRSVSVHPGLREKVLPEHFVAMSARLDEAISILRRIQSKGERALVFIEHREMQFRFAELLRHFFGLARVDTINGDTPIARRQDIVTRFQRHLKQDQGFDVLILGPRAAGTGLTLTAATHVIHLSRWWNPAVEEQCNDRVHRIGQSLPVEVHVPMAIHPGYGAESFDALLQSLMQRKRRMAQRALWPMGDTGAEPSELQAALGRGPEPSITSLAATMRELFLRDGLPDLTPDAEGAYHLP